MALQLIRHSVTSEVVLQAIELMNNLLRFGNLQVQNEILEYLKSRQSEIMSHYLLYMKRVLL